MTTIVTEGVEAIAAKQCADASVTWCLEREGKRFCLWQEKLELKRVGSENCPARRIYRLTERTINKHGQPLLLPEYVLAGWTTTLDASFKPFQVIELYCDHATHEQFHSEFKTDMDLERLPSGKFDTNYLLRLIGQHTLNEPGSPVTGNTMMGSENAAA